MTAKEVQGRIEAFHVNQSRQSKQMDTLAWMIGLYAAKGYHEPKKYPKKPNIIDDNPSVQADGMDEDTIKTILEAYAQTHNAIEMRGELSGSNTRRT